MTAIAELAKHEQGVAEAQQRARSLARDLAELAGKVAELKQQRVQAYADEDERKATQLSTKIADAQAKQEELDERRAGAELASRRAAGERDTWRFAHTRELLAEVEPDARAAAESLAGKIEEVERARQHWHAVRQRIAALVVGAPGFDPRAIPGIDATDQAIRDLRKGVGPIPPPLPGSFAAATVIQVDDPDPSVRQAARAAIVERAG